MEEALLFFRVWYLHLVLLSDRVLLGFGAVFLWDLCEVHASTVCDFWNVFRALFLVDNPFTGIFPRARAR